MSCNNEVNWTVQHGYSFSKVTTKCGNIDPYGDRTICEKCRNDYQKMREIREQQANNNADNAWLKSAGWGEM